MKWLKRKIRDWLTDDDSMQQTAVLVGSDEPRSSPRQDGLNFVLYRAVGGHILECRNYNHKTDRHEGTLYMIHEDEDFAKQVAQAIMLEQMKG